MVDAIREAFVTETFQTKTAEIVMPTGTSITTTYVFGDSFDTFLSKILQLDYTLKSTTWALYDASLKKITSMPAVALLMDKMYLLGNFQTNFSINPVDEVEIIFNTQYEKVQKVCKKSYTVSYYQKLFAILQRKTSSQIWIHDLEIVSPSVLIGTMLPFSTSDMNVFVTFVSTDVYTSLSIT